MWNILWVFFWHAALVIWTLVILGMIAWFALYLFVRKVG